MSSTFRTGSWASWAGTMSSRRLRCCCCCSRSHRATWSDRKLIAASVVSLHVVHVPYWFVGIMGWHYVLETAPLLLLLFAITSRDVVRSETDCGVRRFAACRPRSVLVRGHHGLALCPRDGSAAAVAVRDHIARRGPIGN